MTAISYKRAKNFQSDAGNSTDHGAINAELDRIAAAINGQSDLIGVLLKDDRTLEAGIVQPDALSGEVLALMTGTDVVRVQGPKGDTGASFRADYRGLMAERSSFDDRAKGFCFLAMDTGALYFKLSDAHADWSQGFAFAKGDKGDAGAQGATGAAGRNGTDGVVTIVDVSTKTVNIVGRSSISARLVIEGGRLSIALEAV